MKQHVRSTPWISVVIVALIISGCVQSKMTGRVPPQDPSAARLENPIEMVNQMERTIADARLAELNILSPTGFKQAEAAYLNAKQDLQKGNAIADIRTAIMKSRASLEKAQAFAEVSRTTLNDTLTARDMARKAGATRFEKDYRRVENELISLTQAIEKDNLSQAQKKRETVAAHYRELEVRAVKDDTTGTVHARITQAEEAGARKIAPYTYEETAAQLAATDAFIAANPYAQKEMHAMAEDNLYQANRLVNITAMGNRVKAMVPEAVVLLMESHLQTVTTALDAPDVRDHDFQTQLDNIIASVNALKTDRDRISEKNDDLQRQMDALKTDYQAQIDALNVQVAMLEGKTREDQMAKERMARQRMAVEQRLAEEKKFNQLYATVQGFFATDEAEVYKQENQLVLRLKAMRFPVGKSTILPENDRLLGKVRRAIQTVEDPRVIIEGHTDATGSDETNMLLSQQRAEAVREYLIANQTLAPESISAVGYGSEHPLASNATAAGRAINRRIDILIIPTASPI